SGAAAPEQARHEIRIDAGMAQEAAAVPGEPRKSITTLGAWIGDDGPDRGSEFGADLFVGVERQDPVLARQVERPVLLRPVTGPVRRDLNPRAERGGNITGAVGAGAVQDDDFIGKRHASEARADIGLLILRNHDNRKAHRTSSWMNRTALAQARVGGGIA